MDNLTPTAPQTSIICASREAELTGSAAAMEASGAPPTTMALPPRLVNLFEAKRLGLWTTRQRRAWASRRNCPARFLYYFTVTGSGRVGEFENDEVQALQNAVMPFLKQGWDFDEDAWGIISVAMPGALRTGRQCRDFFFMHQTRIRQQALTPNSSHNTWATREEWFENNLWAAKAALDAALAHSMDRKTVHKVAVLLQKLQISDASKGFLYAAKNDVLSPRVDVVSPQGARELHDTIPRHEDSSDEGESDASHIKEAKAGGISAKTKDNDVLGGEHYSVASEDDWSDEHEPDSDYSEDEDSDQDQHVTLAELLAQRKAKAAMKIKNKTHEEKTPEQNLRDSDIDNDVEDPDRESQKSHASALRVGKDKKNKRKLIRRGRSNSSSDSDQSFRINKVQFNKVRAAIVVSSDEEFEDLGESISAANDSTALRKRQSNETRVKPSASSTTHLMLSDDSGESSGGEAHNTIDTESENERGYKNHTSTLDLDRGFLRGWDDEELAERPSSMAKAKYNELMSLNKKRARKMIKNLQKKLEQELRQFEQKLSVSNSSRLNREQLERLHEQLTTNVQASLLDVTRVLLKRLENIPLSEIQLMTFDAAWRNHDERFTALEKRLRALRGVRDDAEVATSASSVSSRSSVSSFSSEILHRKTINTTTPRKRIQTKGSKQRSRASTNNNTSARHASRSLSSGASVRHHEGGSHNEIGESDNEVSVLGDRQNPRASTSLNSDDAMSVFEDDSDDDNSASRKRPSIISNKQKRGRSARDIFEDLQETRVSEQRRNTSTGRTSSRKNNGGGNAFSHAMGGSNLSGSIRRFFAPRKSASTGSRHQSSLKNPRRQAYSHSDVDFSSDEDDPSSLYPPQPVQEDAATRAIRISALESVERIFRPTSEHGPTYDEDDIFAYISEDERDNTNFDAESRSPKVYSSSKSIHNSDAHTLPYRANRQLPGKKSQFQPQEHQEPRVRVSTSQVSHVDHQRLLGTSSLSGLGSNNSLHSRKRKLPLPLHAFQQNGSRPPKVRTHQEFQRNILRRVEQEVSDASDTFSNTQTVSLPDMHSQATPTADDTPRRAAQFQVHNLEEGASQLLAARQDARTIPSWLTFHETEPEDVPHLMQTLVQQIKGHSVNENVVQTLTSQVHSVIIRTDELRWPKLSAWVRAALGRAVVRPWHITFSSSFQFVFLELLDLTNKKDDILAAGRILLSDIVSLYVRKRARLSGAERSLLGRLYISMGRTEFWTSLRLLLSSSLLQSDAALVPGPERILIMLQPSDHKLWRSIVTDQHRRRRSEGSRLRPAEALEYTEFVWSLLLNSIGSESATSNNSPTPRNGASSQQNTTSELHPVWMIVDDLLKLSPLFVNPKSPPTATLYNKWRSALQWMNAPIQVLSDFCELLISRLVLVATCARGPIPHGFLTRLLPVLQRVANDDDITMRANDYDRSRETEPVLLFEDQDKRSLPSFCELLVREIQQVQGNRQQQDRLLLQVLGAFPRTRAVEGGFQGLGTPSASAPPLAQSCRALRNYAAVLVVLGTSELGQKSRHTIEKVVEQLFMLKSCSDCSLAELLILAEATYEIAAVNSSYPEVLLNCGQHLEQLISTCVSRFALRIDALRRDADLGDYEPNRDVHQCEELFALTDISKTCIIRLKTLVQIEGYNQAEAAQMCERILRLVLHTGQIQAFAPDVLSSTLGLATGLLKTISSSIPKFEFIEDHAPLPPPARLPSSNGAISNQAQGELSLDDIFDFVNEDLLIAQNQIRKRTELIKSLCKSYIRHRDSVQGDYSRMKSLTAITRAVAPHLKSLIGVASGWFLGKDFSTEALRKLFSEKDFRNNKRLRKKTLKAMCKAVGTFAALSVRYGSNPSMAKQTLDTVVKGGLMNAKAWRVHADIAHVPATTLTSLLESLQHYGCLDGFVVQQYAPNFIELWTCAVMEANTRCPQISELHLLSRRMTTFGMLWSKQSDPIVSTSGLAIEMLAAIQVFSLAAVPPNFARLYMESLAQGLAIWWHAVRKTENGLQQARRCANDVLLAAARAVKPSDITSACFSAFLDVALEQHDNQDVVDIFNIPDLPTSKNSLDHIIKEHIRLVGDPHQAVAVLRHAAVNYRRDLFHYLLTRFSIDYKRQGSLEASIRRELLSVPRIQRELAHLVEIGNHEAVISLQRELSEA